MTFTYGIFGKPLEEQANEQGLTLGERAETLEKIKKAITMCSIHVATETQTNSMAKKLQEKVMKAVRPMDV